MTLTVDRCCEQNYVDAWVTQQQNRFDGPRSVNLTLSTTMLTNHDYFIAHRGFFWDLAVYPDEHPSDDPHSPLGAWSDLPRGWWWWWHCADSSE